MTTIIPPTIKRMKIAKLNAEDHYIEVRDNFGPCDYTDRVRAERDVIVRAYEAECKLYHSNPAGYWHIEDAKDNQDTYQLAR